MEATPGGAAVAACRGDTCMAIKDSPTRVSSKEEESDDTPHALACWTWVAGDGVSNTGPRTTGDVSGGTMATGGAEGASGATAAADEDEAAPAAVDLYCDRPPGITSRAGCFLAGRPTEPD